MKMRKSFLYIVFSWIICAHAIEAGQERKKEGEMRDYRNIISRIIMSHGQVLLPKVRERMLEDLKRPFAVGGKSHLMDASPSDLNSGWELFVDGDAVKGVTEFSIESASAREFMLVTVTVSARSDSRDSDKLVVEVAQVGHAPTSAELDRIRFSEKELEKLGLKEATQSEPQKARAPGAGR